MYTENESPLPPLFQTSLFAKDSLAFRLKQLDVDAFQAASRHRTEGYILYGGWALLPVVLF